MRKISLFLGFLWVLVSCGMQVHKASLGLSSSGEFTGNEFAFNGSGIGNPADLESYLWQWSFAIQNGGSTIICETIAGLASANVQIANPSVCLNYTITGTNQNPVITPGGSVSGEIDIEYTLTLIDPEDSSNTVVSTGSVSGGSEDSISIPKYMISTWRMGDPGYGDGGLSITLPLIENNDFSAMGLPAPTTLVNYNYNFTADWGDGTTSEITSWNDPDITHTYAGAGDYTVKLTGNLEAWSMIPLLIAGSGDQNKLLTVTELGDMGWLDFTGAFAECRNLTVVEGGDTAQVVSMLGMFSVAELVDPDVSNWDVSSVTDMSAMFEGARLADPDVSNWDVSSVIDMSYMFENTKLADPDVSNWDVSSVTDMSGMFERAELADPDVSNWDVSSVTDMMGMFAETVSADPDVSNWDVSSVTIMFGMFARALVADPDVSNWDVSSVISMGEMFLQSNVADPDVSNWDVSSLESTRGMFDGAISANPDISNWDISSLTDMGNMFSEAWVANPDFSNWDMSSVTYMHSAFHNAVSFSNENYTNFLIMLNNTNPAGGLYIGSIPAAYQPAGATARTNLLGNGWTFTDEGAE